MGNYSKRTRGSRIEIYLLLATVRNQPKIFTRRTLAGNSSETLAKLATEAKCMVKKQTSRPFAAAKANGPGRPIAQVGPRVVSQARYISTQQHQSDQAVRGGNNNHYRRPAGLGQRPWGNHNAGASGHAATSSYANSV